MSKARDIRWNPRESAAQNASRHLPLLVGEYLGEVRAVLAANPKPPELHAIRLATKRLRYTLELFRPCYGRGLKLRLEALQRLQHTLGEVNDCAAAERQLDGMPGSPARTRTRSFLRRRASAKAAALRKEWRETFEAPGREQWWLQYLAKSARVEVKASL